jgi:hypothetical protein
MLSPEMVNSLIKRPLKQEDLKPPPPPKVRKGKVPPSPKISTAEEGKTPKTPVATVSTPVDTTTPTTTTGKRAQKRKASTATPKQVKKAKNEDTKPATSPVTASTPTAPASVHPPPAPSAPVHAPAPAASPPPAPSASTPSASTPAALGFTGNALYVSRSSHADYFAQQSKGADVAREQSNQFFATRQAPMVFNGDLTAAMNMWAENTVPDGSMGPPMMIPNARGDGLMPPMGLAVPPQTDDALADQSWHDFINENNFEPDEATPMLTRCRSLDTDPECSPRDTDLLLGRSPLVSTHAGIPQSMDKLAQMRRMALMSPYAQPYNGMLLAESEEMGMEGYM